MCKGTYKSHPCLYNKNMGFKFMTKQEQLIYQVMERINQQSYERTDYGTYGLNLKPRVEYEMKLKMPS